MTGKKDQNKSNLLQSIFRKKPKKNSGNTSLYNSQLSEHKSQQDVHEISSLDNAIDIIARQNEELHALRKEMHEQHDKLDKIYHKMRNRTIDLFGRMVDLKKAKRTISIQNEQLKKQRNEIEKSRSRLETTYKKFRERTIDLFGKMIDLKKAKKTITQQNNKLEKQRKKLDEINATKDKFFSIIAHDLKNPIAGFLELTDLLTENWDDLEKKESKELIHLMNKNAKNLFSLLENLLHWSRAQTGNIHFTPEPFNFYDAIEETLSLLKMNIDNKNLKIHNNTDKNCEVIADYNMMSTILRNLLSNAVKFSHERKTIDINSSQENNKLQISIKDRGIGMSQKEKEKLFHIGENVAKPGTSDEKGTGLGLLVCKEFIEKHGGRIWVDSDPFKGSTFSFIIPIKPMEEKTQPHNIQ